MQDMRRNKGRGKVIWGDEEGESGRAGQSAKGEKEILPPSPPPQSPLHKKKRPAEAPAFSVSSLSFCSVAGSLSGEGEAKYGIVQRLVLTLFLSILCRM